MFAQLLRRPTHRVFEIELLSSSLKLSPFDQIDSLWSNLSTGEEPEALVKAIRLVGEVVERVKKFSLAERDREVVRVGQGSPSHDCSAAEK
jgi:hypothetical protein